MADQNGPVLADTGDRLATATDPYALYRLRNDPRLAHPALQNYLGPYEHRQFIQELMQTNPMLGVLSASAAPAYTAAKAMGMTNARSQPSLEEIFQAWRGLTPFRMF